MVDAIPSAVDGAGIDLLVMGSHGPSRLESVFHGETVAGVHHRIRVPLLVVPSKGDAAEALARPELPEP